MKPDQVVENALTQLFAMVNPSTGIGPPRDKEHAKEVLLEKALWHSCIFSNSSQMVPVSPWITENAVVEYSLQTDKTELDECPPESDTVTSYDRKCFGLYIMLLDADAIGTEWFETYELAFRRSIDGKIGSVRLQYLTHLERAKWITNFGYRQLL